MALGLIRPCGEVFPRWIPFLGGKPVRPRTAIVPAALVAAMMTSISLTVLVDTLINGNDAGEVRMPTWAGLLLGVLPFLAWGIFLAAATLAYYYRRRGKCFRCENQRAASS